MSISKTFNNTSYSIPTVRGETGWELTLSSYLQALADYAATTTFNKQATRKATATPVTVSAATDCVIVVDLAVAGASTVNLPAGADKQIFIVLDGKGDAATNSITIDANGSETIEGSLTKVINWNRGSLALQYNSSAGDWKVLSAYNSSTVVGPASATDNAIARFDGTTGKLVQNSDCSISDTGAVTLGPSSGLTTSHVIQNSNTGNNVLTVSSAASSGARGLQIKSGLASGAGTASEYPIIVSNTTGTVDYFYISGDGAVRFANNANVLDGAKTAAGAWSFGSATAGNRFHNINGNIAIWRTNGDAGIGQNCFFDAPRDFNRTSTAAAGSAIIFAPNTTATSKVMSLVVNAPGEGLTTAADEVLNVNATGSIAHIVPSICSVRFGMWNPSDVVGTITDCNSRTIDIAGPSNVYSVSTVSGGIVTFTFNEAGTYFVSVNSYVTHANVFTSSRLTINYGGTCGGLYYMVSNQQVDDNATQDVDGGTSWQFPVVATAAAQTLTVRMRYQVTGSGANTDHDAHGSVTIQRAS